MNLAQKVMVAVGSAAAVTLGLVGPAAAAQNIPWTWNSGDHDSQAMFQAYGEHIYAYEYSGSDYVDYQYASNTGLRWQIPGSDDRTKKDLDLTIAEGKVVGLQVCEEKTGLPDDCSAWKWGVS